MANTGFIHHPRCLDHVTGPDHPESPARLQSVLDRVAASGLGAELHQRQPEPADSRWLIKVHDEGYVRHVAEACQQAPALLDSFLTRRSAESIAVADILCDIIIPLG